MAHAYKQFDWYEEPLYYDMIFGLGTVLECDFLEAMYERYVPRGSRRVLEPACGSGRLVAEMARRGYRVTGFDISDGALAFARQRLARTAQATARRARGTPRLVKARMESFQLGQTFDLAHCLVSSFLYLLTEEHARAHLEAVARALRPGGIYVLGLHLSEYHARSISRERWIASRDGIRVVCTIQHGLPRRGSRRQPMRSRFVVEERGRVTRCESAWEFRTYSVRQLRALLAKVPALVHVDTYGFDHDPEQPCSFGKERLDPVLILQRR